MRLSAFDLDHTLLKINSSFRFGAYLYRTGHISFVSMLYAVGCYSLHKMGLLTMRGMHRRLFARLFRKHSAVTHQSLADQFVAEQGGDLLYEPALQRLRLAQQQGHYTVLLSSSPDFLVAPFAQFLGIDKWAATPYLIDTQQRFSALGEVLQGEKKRRIIEDLMQSEGVTRDAVYAYSDSHLDLPLLEAAGHATGVNPTQQLRSICLRRKWEII
jgi:HAD superfamily hydrolase (TIGR01490 family)